MRKLFLVLFVAIININMSRGLIKWRKSNDLNPDEIIEISHEYMKVRKTMFLNQASFSNYKFNILFI